MPDNNDNTQLSEADITAMGFIQTQSDTQDLSISGHTISLTNGGSVTVPDNNTQLSSADITAMGFSTTDNNTQRSDEEIRDVAAAQWVNGTNTTVVVSDASNTIKINSVNTDTNTQLSEADITAMGFIQTQSDTQDLSISGHTISLTNGGSVTVPDNNTQRTNAEIDARIALNPEGFIDSYTDTNTQLSDGDIAAFGYIKTYTDTNTQRAIHDSPVNGATTISISSNWAFDNVKTAVPSGALFTDTNTNTQLSEGDITAMGFIQSQSDSQTLSISGQTLSLTNGGSVTLPDTNTFRGIHDSPVNGATTTSISSNWAFDNVKTSVPSGALFTDTDTNTQRTDAEIDARIALNPEGFIDSYTDTNTQLSDGDIAAFGYIKTYTDTNTQRAIHDSPVNGATTTSISSNWAFDNVKTSVPSGALFTDTNTNTQRTDAEIDARIALNPEGFIDSYTDTNTQLSDGDIAAFGYIKTYTDTNTQRGIHDTPVNGSTTISISSNWAFDNVKTAVPSGAVFTDTNTNTQLSDGDIAAMGYIKTYTDTNTQLSESEITAMGFIQSFTDTNTQLSDADIAAFGYIKTDNNTQLSDADIAAFGYIKTDNNTQLSSADITAMGFSTTDNNTQLSESEITAMGFTQSAGTVGGSGADNRIPKFSTGGSNVENSTISDSGTQVSFSEGSLLLNDTTFNQIKMSGNTQILGTVADNETLKIGTSSVGWKTISIYSPTIQFKSGADADFIDLAPQLGLVTASGGFKKDGGTSSQFLKADGSVDSTTYATGTIPTNSDFIDLTTNQSIGGEKTFEDDAFFSGSLEADEFVGDGSNLTGLDYSQLANTPSSGVTGSGTSGTFPLWTSTGAALNNSSMSEDSTDILMDKSLTINGGAGDAILNLVADAMNTDENDNCIINFSQDGNNTKANIGLQGDAGTVFTNSIANSLVAGTDTSSPVQFYTNSAARMTIDSSGDVGIGTNNPTALLDVNGTSNFTGTATFEGNFGNLDTSGDKGVQFEVGSTGLNTMRCDADSWRIYFGGTTGIGQAYIVNQLGQHDWDGSSGVNRMRLTAAGTLHVDGDVVAYSTTVSDKRLKDNIETIDNASETVKKLRGVSYEWNAGDRKGQKEIGLVAQEVEEVLPFLVREHELPLNRDVDNETLYKTVDYEKIVGLLIEDSKEKDARIEKLEALVEQMIKNK